MKAWKSILLSAAACAMFASAPNPASANPGARTRTARPAAKKAPLSTRAKAFKPARVNQRLQQKLGKKQLMQVTTRGANGGNLSKYVKAMHKDTVELIFMGGYGSGHTKIRIGEKLYDQMPGGPRSGLATRGMHGSRMYGFSFKVGKTRVAELQRKYDAFAATRPSFSMTGMGPTCYSCAAFVTKLISKEAPKLQIRFTNSAKGMGYSLFRNPNVHAITLYNDAAKGIGDANGRLADLE